MCAADPLSSLVWGHLGLARSGDGAAGCGSGRGVAVLGRVDLTTGEGGDVWNLCVLEGARSLASGGPLSVLLVGGQVEGNEEDEVGADDAHSGEGSEFLAGAVTRVGHPWPVGRGEVGVGREVDEAWVLLARKVSESDVKTYQDQSRIG